MPELHTTTYINELPINIADIMENQPQQINIDLSKSSSKPIFADEIAIAARLKAFQKDKKSPIEKEGHVALIFLDMTKQQAVGEFIISRFTARGLIASLSQTLEQLEKELASKEMPKQQQMKTTTTSDLGSTSIR